MEEFPPFPESLVVQVGPIHEMLGEALRHTVHSEEQHLPSGDKLSPVALHGPLRAGLALGVVGRRTLTHPRLLRVTPTFLAVAGILLEDLVHEHFETLVFLEVRSAKSSRSWLSTPPAQ